MAKLEDKHVAGRELRFRNRVLVALVQEAFAHGNTTGTQPKKVKRREYARQVLRNPASFLNTFADLVAALAEEPSELKDDIKVQELISSVWNAVSGAHDVEDPSA